MTNQKINITAKIRFYYDCTRQTPIDKALLLPSTKYPTRMEVVSFQHGNITMNVKPATWSYSRENFNVSKLGIEAEETDFYTTVCLLGRQDCCVFKEIDLPTVMVVDAQLQEALIKCRKYQIVIPVGWFVTSPEMIGSQALDLPQLLPRILDEQQISKVVDNLSPELWENLHETFPRFKNRDNLKERIRNVFRGKTQENATRLLNDSWLNTVIRPIFIRDLRSDVAELSRWYEINRWSPVEETIVL